MMTSTPNESDLKQLKKLHQQSLENNGSNEKYRNDIIDAFGGIDTILAHIIDTSMNSEDHEANNTISKSQWNKIFKILSLEEHNKNKSKSDKLEMTVYFDKNNTILHSIFNENKANMICRIIYNKCIMIFFVILPLLAIFGSIDTEPEDGGSFVMWQAFAILALIISSLYFILLILSGNTRALKLLFVQIEFWIKAYYAAGVFVVTIIRDYGVFRPWLIMPLYMIVWVVFFGFTEALNISWKVIATMGFIFSFFATASAFITTFLSSGDMIIQIGPLQFSTLEYTASALRILSIFLWKQTIMAVRRRGKKCIIIKVAPYIKWVDDGSKIEQTMTEIVNNDNLEMATVAK